MNIVIVDDESVICDGLHNLILTRGEDDWSVLKVSTDPEETLEGCDWDQADLLLVDINMPGMSGLEMVETLRERGFDTLVIIISGYTEFEYARQAIKNNAVDFIIKPVSPQKLLSAIARAQEILIQRKELKNSQWYIQKNLKKLTMEFFEEYLYETKKISAKNKEHMIACLNLIGKKYALVEFLSGTEKEIIKTLIEEIQKTCNANIYCYTAGSGLCTLLVIYNSNEEFNGEEFKKTMETEIREIVWSDIIYTDNPDQLPHMHNKLLFQLRKTNYAKGLSNILSVTQQNSTMKVRDDQTLPVQKAVRFIHKNYANPLSLTILSEEVNIHPTYLSNLFKKQTGFSLIDYINHFRVVQAKKLLQDPLSKIYWVSEQAGFLNQRYFSQVFKKITGFTPVQYRSNYYLNMVEDE